MGTGRVRVESGNARNGTQSLLLRGPGRYGHSSSDGVVMDVLPGSSMYVHPSCLLKNA